MNQPNQPVDKAKVFADLQQLIQFKGSDIIKKVYEGSDGGDYAVSVIDVFGIDVWAKIAAVGESTIIEAFQSVPAFWAKLQSKEAETRAWVHQFVTYDPAEDEEGVMPEGSVN